MKGFFTLLFCALFLCTGTYGQILGINKPLFSDQPFFNPDFVRINSIQSITGSISTKKVKDIIRTTGNHSHYTFNESGMLNSQLSSKVANGRKDSSITFYEYNVKGLIDTKRKSEGSGYYSYQYRYDNSNHIIAQTYCRDENKFGKKTQFELKKRYIIKTDSFSYEQFSPEQSKQIFYNHYGKKYKVQINSYESLGYLTEEYTKFIIGNTKTKVSYEYDKYGRLSKKHFTTNFSAQKKTTEIYSYDEIGNILDIKYFDMDIHKSTKQFLYDDKTMLLSAIIDQEVASHFLKIIKYDYTFFDGSTNLTELNRLSITNSQ